jgi:hypothetical protein
MPSLKLEEFDLIPLIKDTVNLIGDEEAEIIFSSKSEKVFIECLGQQSGNGGNSRCSLILRTISN